MSATTTIPTNRITELRDTEFAAISRAAYFDHASDSPLPARSARVLAERIELLQNPLATVPAREGYLDRARTAVGALLGAEPENLAFLTNVADTTAAIANGIAWRDGDEVLIVAGEFATFVYPWKALEPRGVRVRAVPKAGVATDLAAVRAAITPRTRVLAISDVEFTSGFRNDLAALSEIAHSAGALFVVDVSQSLGVLPIGATKIRIDVAVSVGYKWLMSPHGIGVLYVAPNAIDQILPSAAGRYSIESGWDTAEYPTNWFADGRRYQGGALNWISVCALAESSGLLTEIGIEAIYSAATGVIDQILERLAPLDVRITSDLRPQHRSSIVTFTFGSQPRDDAFVDFARPLGVILGRRAHGIRVGAHFWNDASDVDRLIAAVETFLTTN